MISVTVVLLGRLRREEPLPESRVSVLSGLLVVRGRDGGRGGAVWGVGGGGGGGGGQRSGSGQSWKEDIFARL